MSPSVAKMYHADLMLAKGAEELANSRTNPPAAWIYALHQKWTQTNFGGLKSGPEFFRFVKKKNYISEQYFYEQVCKVLYNDLSPLLFLMAENIIKTINTKER